MACEGGQVYQLLLSVYLTTLLVAEIHSAGSIATSNVLKTAKAFKNDIFTSALISRC
jgi:hypothetical protein